MKDPVKLVDPCLNYEFIQNPAKKAFFEGTRSTSVSPRSLSSPRSKQQVTFNDKDEILTQRFVNLHSQCKHM